MLTRECDELEIQKCIDNELSARETSELLRRLDRINDGWKTLACGFLEDRRIRSVLPLENRRAIADVAVRKAPSEPASALQTRAEQVGIDAENPKPSVARNNPEPRVIKVNDLARHWWSHPVTSLTLCAAIAFVGGLLIPDLNSPKLASSNSPTKTNAPARSRLYPATANGAQEYRVELQPGGRSVEIPVVTDLSKLHELDRRHPIFSRSRDNSENVQWMVLPVDGNKAMLIPVSEDPSSEMQ